MGLLLRLSSLSCFRCFAKVDVLNSNPYFHLAPLLLLLVLQQPILCILGRPFFLLEKHM
jgi:hypothetical protein